MTARYVGAGAEVVEATVAQPIESRVIGVDNLRVCDASLMPSIPCANTNVPTIMIAERIADLVKAGAQKKTA